MNFRINISGNHKRTFSDLQKAIENSRHHAVGSHSTLYIDAHDDEGNALRTLATREHGGELKIHFAAITKTMNDLQKMTMTKILKSLDTWRKDVQSDLASDWIETEAGLKMSVQFQLLNTAFANLDLIYQDKDGQIFSSSIPR